MQSPQGVGSSPSSPPGAQTPPGAGTQTSGPPKPPAPPGAGYPGGPVPPPGGPAQTKDPGYDPFKKPGIPGTEKTSIFNRSGLPHTLVILGVLSIVMGASLCALSGMIFRPERLTGEYTIEDVEDYNDDVESRNQIRSFIHMLGSTGVLMGLLLIMMYLGLIVVSSNYPTGVRITAGILLAILIPVFAFIFLLAGPFRLLANSEGGEYYPL